MVRRDDPPRFSGDQECYYGDDLRILSSLSKKEHMRGNETLLDFRTSKFVLRISRDSYQLLKRHLQERQNNQIWTIIQEPLYIDIFDGMPRSKSQIDAMSGSLAGEAKRDSNKAKVGVVGLWACRVQVHCGTVGVNTFTFSRLFLSKATYNKYICQMKEKQYQ